MAGETHARVPMERPCATALVDVENEKKRRELKKADQEKRRQELIDDEKSNNLSMEEMNELEELLFSTIKEENFFTTLPKR